LLEGWFGGCIRQQFGNELIDGTADFHDQVAARLFSEEVAGGELQVIGEVIIKQGQPFMGLSADLATDGRGFKV
jgi:hypothetical protein